MSNSELYDESRIKVSVLLSIDNLEIINRHQLVVEEEPSVEYRTLFVPDVQKLFIANDVDQSLFMVDFSDSSPTLEHYAFPKLSKNPFAM